MEQTNMKNITKGFAALLLGGTMALTAVFGTSDAIALASTELGEYEVQAGDTLTKIAKKYHLTVAELKEFNNLTDDKIKVGQILATEDLKQEVTEASIYAVQSGDTLYSIARAFETTVAELKKLNNLKTDAIKAGTELKVPTFEVATFKAKIIGAADNNSLEIYSNGEYMVITTSFAVNIANSLEGETMFVVIKKDGPRPMLLEMLPIEKK